jgi:hypothetical protein
LPKRAIWANKSETPAKRYREFESYSLGHSVINDLSLYWLRRDGSLLLGIKRLLRVRENTPDQAQRFMSILNEENEQVDILDHASRKILSTFGRPGHQAGEFSHGHTMAVDSKGNVYVTEVGVGNEAAHRVQKFKMAANH